MSCVNIRGCRIGEGRPKVILPIVERTEAAILEKAAQFSTLLADCVEWRADWFEGFQSPAAIARCVQKLRVVLRDKLLLVTFRTKAEGGEQALSHKEYLAFLRLILDTDCADLLDIFFIDYLNLIHIPYTRGSRNETTDLALGDVVRKVKLMAVELDVPAVLLAQMNRDSDRRLAPYLPILSDLRNSGAIEQVADQVIFVYRAEKYGILYDKDTKEDLRGVGYLLVAKNRNGATGRARFRYNVSMTRFLSYENRLL